jgi:hypothetical protein
MLTPRPSSKDVLKLKYGTHHKPSGGIEKTSTRKRQTKNKYIKIAKATLTQLMAVDGDGAQGDGAGMVPDNDTRLNGFGARMKF